MSSTIKNDHERLSLSWKFHFM